MNAPEFEDIVYEIDGPAAIVTLNRPHRYNAFRGQTIEELIAAFRAAWADRAVRAVILTGSGDKAFCTGGDVKQRAETGSARGSGRSTPGSARPTWRGSSAS